jgi:plastocyanin
MKGGSMSRNSRQWIGALALTAGLAISGGMASATIPAKAAAHVATATITIKNFDFSPMKLKASPGEKITVHNADSVTHTLSAVKGQAFNTGNIPAGGTKSFKAPMHPGSYSYICDIHQFMHGTIVVIAH